VIEQPTGEGPVESNRDRAIRLGLVAVILIAILGGAYVISERNGLDIVGEGGVNAQLIPKVGEPAPELLVVTTENQLVPLSALKGQPVWINFWGAWCQPCRAEMPDVIRAYDTLSAEGIVMLGVNEGDTAEEALNYASTVGINFPIVFPIRPSDEEIEQLKASGQYAGAIESLESAKKWQINNWPTHFFIDTEGIVRAVVIAPMTYETALDYGRMILPDGGLILPATPESSPEASPTATPST
jgi:thiol-disulfide isomerase/thioredoxin